MLKKINNVDKNLYICAYCDIKAIPCSYKAFNKPAPYFKFIDDHEKDCISKTINKSKSKENKRDRTTDENTSIKKSEDEEIHTFLRLKEVSTYSNFQDDNKVNVNTTYRATKTSTTTSTTYKKDEYEATSLKEIAEDYIKLNKKYNSKNHSFKKQFKLTLQIDNKAISGDYYSLVRSVNAFSKDKIYDRQILFSSSLRDKRIEEKNNITKIFFSRFINNELHEYYLTIPTNKLNINKIRDFLDTNKDYYIFFIGKQNKAEKKFNEFKVSDFRRIAFLKKT